MPLIKSDENKIIFGFYKKEDSKIINNHPRIYIGIKDYETGLKRVGYKVFFVNNKLTLDYYFYDISESIEFCDINTKYMEDQDIQFLKNIKFF